MKYTIHINQFCWEKNDSKSLDIVDLALYDAIKTFIISSRAQTISVHNHIYYWVSPNMLIEEMPILGISTTRGINKRIDKLIDAKLLERCPENQSTKRTYVTMGEKYNQYECYHIENENSSLGTDVPTPTWNECSNNNNTNIDHNTNTYIKEIDKEKDSDSKSRALPQPPNAAAPLPQKKTIEEKEKEFREKVYAFKDKYPVQMLDAFINYWAQKVSENGNKMLYESQKAFEISRRLATWASRDYNKPKYNQPQKNNQANPKKGIWDDLGVTEEYYKTRILGK